MQPTKRILFDDRGMTLIEIMIVIAIIAGLMTVLGGQAVGFLAKAKVKESLIQLRNISTALDHYNMDCNDYPSDDIGLEALTEDPGREVCSNWGPQAYMKKSDLTDQFGNQFTYELVDGEPVVMFLGRDGRVGGKDLDRDASSADGK